ncbi:MAG: phosphoribosylanthranilate isomerase [Alphaproteobacteria bacterium]|nr:phosphoribosylanthranilate isomerase [Alphaproteobacteria bacterium]
MRVTAKICGIATRDALNAAMDGGAVAVGFVFYPPSPRAVDLTAAAGLAAAVRPDIERVGLFVDADDETFANTLARVPLDVLQLHGGETPARVRDVRQRYRLPVMKAIAVGSAADLDGARAYLQVADRLLFDAKPPRDATRPGGNALAFDWALLAGRSWSIPWLLSGGLTPENVVAAVRVTGARAVDVSSGVEDRPGKKNPARIAAFLQAVAELGRAG